MRMVGSQMCEFSRFLLNVPAAAHLLPEGLSVWMQEEAAAHVPKHRGAGRRLVLQTVQRKTEQATAGSE